MIGRAHASRMPDGSIRSSSSSSIARACFTRSMPLADMTELDCASSRNLMRSWTPGLWALFVLVHHHHAATRRRTLRGDERRSGRRSPSPEPPTTEREGQCQRNWDSSQVPTRVSESGDALETTRSAKRSGAKFGGEGGIRTHVPVTRQDAFEASPLRPLRYLSV